MSEILHIFIEPYSLTIKAGPLAGVSILVFFIYMLLFNTKVIKKFRPTKDIEMNISLGGIGSVKIAPNHNVIQIAHRAWTELKTRKASILFEQDHDVIIEVYDSWYKLFGEMRELIKSIPAQCLKDPNTAKLVDVMIKALNDGLRPHLTQWQAKYRRWYKKKIDDDILCDNTPQEVQRMYPDYTLLITDLKQINQQLIQYANEIKKLYE